MSKIFSLSDIEIYKEALKLANKVYTLTKHPKIKKDYYLIEQLRKASLSVAVNIAEGYGRKTNKDFSQFLSISLGSANEMIAYLDFISMEYNI